MENRAPRGSGDKELGNELVMEAWKMKQTRESEKKKNNII